MGRHKGGHNKSTFETAERIWDLCSEHGRVGLTKAEICENYLDLSPSQFNNAMRLIKDLFQEEKEQPIIYKADTHRYVFNPREKEARRYGEWTLKRWQTQVERSKHYVEALEMKFGENRRTKRLRLHTELLLNSIEEMLETVAEEEEATV